MKKLFLVFVLGFSATALAQQEDYVPWTFDDFNANCEVINDPLYENAVSEATFKASKPFELSAKDVGELGW